MFILPSIIFQSSEGWRFIWRCSRSYISQFLISHRDEFVLICRSPRIQGIVKMSRLPLLSTKRAGVVLRNSRVSDTTQAESSILPEKWIMLNVVRRQSSGRLDFIGLLKKPRYLAALQQKHLSCLVAGKWIRTTKNVDATSRLGCVELSTCTECCGYSMAA